MDGLLMENIDFDEEYLVSRARQERRSISATQEDAYNARIRVLVIDQKKSNCAARRIAFDEIIGI